MPEFRRSRSAMEAAGIEALDMKQQHAVEGAAGQIFIRLGAAPPFNAFGHARDAVNQFALRARASQFRPAAIGEVEALLWRPALPRPIGENALHWNTGRRAAAPLRLSPP
jgi:hypothetical protein